VIRTKSGESGCAPDYSAPGGAGIGSEQLQPMPRHRKRLYTVVQTLQNFINGEFVTPAGTELLDIVNPTNGEIVAHAPVSTAADVDAAMNAAKEAFKSWKHVTPGHRQLMLLKLADAIEANSDELVEAQHRNTGQVRALIASEEVAAGADQLRFFAGAARIMEGKSAGEYF